MRFMILIVLFCSINSFAQDEAIHGDTIFRKENVMLYLNNGFAIPPFAVSGDIYLTNNHFIFHARQYRRKRFDMYNDLIKDITVSYEDLIVAKRSGIFNLKLKTETRKYIISDANNWGRVLRSMILLINQLKHAAKKDTDKVKGT